MDDEKFTSGRFKFEVQPHILDNKQLAMERLDVFSTLKDEVAKKASVAYVDGKVAEVSGIDTSHLLTTDVLQDYATKEDLSLKVDKSELEKYSTIEYVDDSGIDLLGIYTIAKL